MELYEKTLNERYAYHGRIINLRVDDVELPDGSRSDREIIEHNGGVCVVPLDSEGNIYCVRQFRSPYKEVLLEIPAGKRDGDEQPLTCGVRELKEEVGATAKNMVPLGKLYPTPGYCAEIIWMYLATDLSFSEQQLDDGEFLNVEKISLEKAVDMILSGEITDAKTQTAVLKVKLMKDKGLC